MKLETMQALTGLARWSDLWDEVKKTGWDREETIQIRSAASIDYKSDDGPPTVMFKPQSHTITLDFLKARTFEESLNKSL